ncbi:MAG TPA: hypothetical protein VM011_00785 [Gammaproteobacteria bacterium]|nr:hypothetical protein [Gammaproteobacteria bacterium]
MIANRRLRGMHLVLMLAAGFLLQASHAEEPEIQFKYSDEWSLVSAPPPAGPYQPVNIDPRVPGVGTIPQVPMVMPRQQAAQESFPDDTMVGGVPGGAVEQAAPEIMTRAAPGETRTMPPVPGHYQSVMAQPASEAAAESRSEDEAVTAQQEQTVETVVTMEAEAPDAPATAAASVAEPVAGQAPAAGSSLAAVPEHVPAAMPVTAGTDMEQPSAETAAAMLPEETAGTPAMPGRAAPTLPLAVSEEPQAPAQLTLPPAQVAQPHLTGQVPAAADTLADQPPQGQEAIPAPAVAGATSELPASEQPATATREQPLFQPPMPGDYDRMMPPAAGRMARETPVAPGPAEPLQGQAAERMPAPGYYDRMMPPAAGRMAPETPVAPGPAKQLQGQAPERAPAAGYYGRPMPPAGRGYNYPAPGGYPYQSGAPGYWNMPAYGYPRGQARPEEQNVPPPPVYDSMQYPQAPMQGYR